MVSRVDTLTNTQPLVDDKGISTQQMRSWSAQVDRQLIITGTGSPEGVVGADVTAEYMDETGTTGNIKYIKRDSDIAGDKTLGWILI